MPSFSPAVLQLIAKQRGLASSRQLRARGLTDGQIRHAVRSGRLFVVHPEHGIYTVAPLEQLRPEVGLLAAVLAFQGRAITCRRSAGHRWELLERAPKAVELASRLHLTPPAGVVIVRTYLRPGDVVRNDGLRLTTVERTLLDLATVLPNQALDRALREAEFHHSRRPVDLAAVLRRGHPGSARLRAALERHVPGWGEAKSKLERRFRTLLVAHDVPLPLRNHRVGPWTADCVWPALRVVVELDGGQHERPGQAKVDADRDLWLRQNGWVVRRYTWDQVSRRGAAVVADLHAAFEEATASANLVNSPSRVTV